MLISRVFKEISCFQGPKWKNLRFLSSQKVLEKVVKKNERKYLKQITPQELQPWHGCNLHKLFAGTIDKRILEYPTVVSNESINTVLNHSQAVESFFSLNENIKLTNDVIEKLQELELFGLSVPQNFGGAGYNETESKFLLECTGRNPVVARFLGYKEDFGCRILYHYGTEEQKKKYLPDLAEGKRFMTLAYLENNSILDLSKIEGFVISNIEKNCFSLSAQKKWVHFADKADLFLVLAKSAVVEDEFENEIKIKFQMFIVEKDMPGVTVLQLKPHWAEKANIFEVNFKNVTIPFSNVLGGPDSNGYDILKFGLCHNNLTDAILSLSIMKCMLYDAIQYVEEKGLKDITVRGHLYIRESIATFISYIYALESVTYLLTGSLDMYEKPDLFNDSVMAKVLAAEFLPEAIQIYTEIIGRESFKKSGILEEAIEVMQYNSVFNENIEYLKLMSAADGLTAVANKLAKKVAIFRNKFDNPFEFFKLGLRRNSDAKKLKSQLNLKMELHSMLSGPADTVEESLVKLLDIVESLFIANGSLAIYCEHAVTNLAEAASYIFASIACLSRASSSICYDVNNYKNEALIAYAFTKIADIKIKKLFEEELMHSELLESYQKIGKNAFSYKEYPMEHPLARVF